MQKFDELLANFASEQKIRIGVVCANDEVTIQSVFNEKVREYLEPILIGDETRINEILTKHHFSARIVSADTEEKCAAIGVEMVRKNGLLAAAEKVNPKISSSVEAEEIMLDMQEEAPDSCYIDGPISLDLSLSKEVAAIKHYESPVAGDADIVVGPDITTMNVLGKSLTILAGAKMAGLIMGASVPIVMVSRGSTEEEKAYSILVAMYCSKR